MRRNQLMLALCLSSFVFTAACSVKPDAGYEAVLIRKPWFFGQGGVAVFGQVAAFDEIRLQPVDGIAEGPERRLFTGPVAGGQGSG